MNVLIVDLDKIDLENASHFYKKAIEISGCDDWIILPKGMDLLQDMPIEWMKAVRDQLNEKIKGLESDKNDKTTNG